MADEVRFFHEPPKNDGSEFDKMYYRQGMHERYGPIVLSIQAGYGNYCTPRDTYLPNIADYKSIEIAMFDLRMPSKPDKFDGDFAHMGDWTSPDKLSIPEFENLFGTDDVEGWVSWNVVNNLREALTRKFGGIPGYSLDGMTRDVNGYTREEFQVYQRLGPDGVRIFRQAADSAQEVWYD